MKTLTSLNLTIDDHLLLIKDISHKLINEPKLQHQIEQLIHIRNKMKEQFNVIFIYSVFIMYGK